MADDRYLSDAPPRGHRRSLALGLSVAAVFVVLDQVTKELAEAFLELGRFIPLLGEHIGWQLVYNQGGAFGVAAPHWIFLVVTVIVVVVVARALPRTASRLTATAYGLLLAGAVGNVIDRLFRPSAPHVGDAPDLGGGAVVDFVAWGTFPRFNVADSAITVGFALLVVALWHEERQATKHDDGGLQAIASAIGVTPASPARPRTDTDEADDPVADGEVEADTVGGASDETDDDRPSDGEADDRPSDGDADDRPSDERTGERRPDTADDARDADDGPDGGNHDGFAPDGRAPDGPDPDGGDDHRSPR